jgi:hypothetical protein
MRATRPRRRRQGAQAAIEMAMVLPIMITIVFGFVGMMLELRAENELQTAVDLSAQAALVPPLGQLNAPAGYANPSTADYTYAFSHTLNPNGQETGFLNVTNPISCTGPYLEGEIQLNSQGYPEPVTCTAQANLSFSDTPLSLLWFWTVHLSATADAYPPPYRQCQVLSGSTSPYQC